MTLTRERGREGESKVEVSRASQVTVSQSAQSLKCARSVVTRVPVPRVMKALLAGASIKLSSVFVTSLVEMRELRTTSRVKMSLKLQSVVQREEKRRA